MNRGTETDRPGRREEREAALRRLAEERSERSATPTQQAADALHDLGSPHGTSRLFLAPQHPRASRRRAILVMTIVVVVLAAGGAYTMQRLRQGATGRASAATHALPVSVISVFTQASLRCTSRPVWSPDGHSFAVIGTRATQCTPFLESLAYSTVDAPNLFSPPQTLAIFDASSGHLINSFNLDPLLGNRPNCNAQGQCGDDTARADLFYSLSWSPDGQWLALAYIDGFPLPSAPYPLAVTLLAMHPDGTDATRIREEDRNFLGMYGENNPGMHIWDLRAHTVHQADTTASYPYSAHFSDSYQWSGDDTITATSAQTPSPSGGPVGNPAGGASFTPWQPGVVVPAGATGGSSAALFETLFWSWSPDGRYVATFLSTGGLLQPAGTPPVTVTPEVPGSYLPAIAPRDAALQQVVNQVVALNGGVTSVQVAWSPDGSKLAALRCTDAAAGQVEILSTATGNVLGVGTLKYVATGASQGCAGDMQGLAWSPDGTRIMTGDTASATVTIWHVA